MKSDFLNLFFVIFALKSRIYLEKQPNYAIIIKKYCKILAIEEIKCYYIYQSAKELNALWYISAIWRADVLIFYVFKKEVASNVIC